MESNSFTQFPYIGELVDSIKSILPIHSIYVLALTETVKETTAFTPPLRTSSEGFAVYTLVLVSLRSFLLNTTQVTVVLLEKMHYKCKVYPITFIIEDVIDRVDEGNNFLTRILNHAPCIYKVDESLSLYSKFSPILHKSMYTEIKAEWKRRNRRAGYLLTTVGNDGIDMNVDPSAQLGLLHYALEQMFLGIVYLFWEFSPVYYPMDHLLHFCGVISELRQRIFSQRQFETKRIFRLLCMGNRQMRTRSCTVIAQGDVDKAYKLCERFHNESILLGSRQLKSLKRLHCTRS